MALYGFTERFIIFVDGRRFKNNAVLKNENDTNIFVQRAIAKQIARKFFYN